MNNQQVTVRKDLKTALEAYKPRLQEILKDRAPQFAAALVQVVNKSWNLQKCKPETVIGAAITAAALDLSFDPALGEAHLVPFSDQATFMLGYRGIVQLAQRSGQYKRLGWMVVYDGQLKEWNPLTGELVIDVKAKKANAPVIGYASYFQLISGFERGEYWTKDEVMAHAARFSQAYKQKKKDSPWNQDGPSGFDRMALKTVLFALLRPWGPKSIVMQRAMSDDNTIRVNPDASAEPIFDMPPEDVTQEDPPEATQDEKGAPSTPPAPEKLAQSSPANAATPPNAPAGEKKPTIQDELSKVVIDAGFSFDEFRTWAAEEGHLGMVDASSVGGFAEVPEPAAKRLIRSRVGMLAALTKKRLT